MLQGRVKHFMLRLLPVEFEPEPDSRPSRISACGEQSVYRQLLGNGAQVIDVGAGFGQYTSLFSHLVGKRGRVFSIEPIPVTHAILRSNIQRQTLVNVELFQQAISSEPGRAWMEVPRHISGGENFYQARIVADASKKMARSIEVDAVSLDALFGHQRAIDLIRCDVLGHELLVLQGATEILRKAKPAWSMGVSGDPEDGASEAAEVFRIFSARGYQPFYFDGEQLQIRSEGLQSERYFFLTQRHMRRLG